MSGRRWLRAASDTQWVLSVTDNTTGVSATPTVAFSTTSDGGVVRVDASGSFSTNGPITSSTIAFGDGTTVSARTASHAYASAGVYTITVSLTDSLGRTASRSKLVAVDVPSNVNIAPTAALRVSSTDLTATLDASDSTDPDGVVASYRFSFGDSATAVTTTSPTTAHTYSSPGSYTCTVTVFDNKGASNAASRTVTVTAPVVTPPVINLPYTNDDGLGTNSGAQVPASSSVVLLNLNGSDIASQVNAAGTKRLSLPVGTVQKLNPWSGSQQYAGIMTGGGGIIGAGSKKSTISQVPNASTGQTSTYGSNLLRTQPPAGSQTFQDFTLLGTDQDQVEYHGGFIILAPNTTLRRVVFRRAGVGNDKAPPGETFAINCYNFQGGLYLEDVEIDGTGTGASGLGTNGSGNSSSDNKAIGDYTVNRLYTHDNWYSGGIALWQQKGTATFNDCVFANNRCHWNIERCAGQVILNRPRIGPLKSAASGWANGYAPPTHIFAEAGTGWTTEAEARAFQFIINDPRNLDGSTYSGGKLSITLGSATGGTNFYTRTGTFKAYSPQGVDISTSIYA